MTTTDPEQSRQGQLEHILVLTGPGGGGKTTALRALEDIGYYCIDNLPTVLLEQFIEVVRGKTDIARVALVVDARERDFFDQAPAVVESLIAADQPIELLFLDSDDKTLLRRYSETRRLHPLAGAGGNVRDGIAQERLHLETLQRLAHARIDTSAMTVHDLKRVMQQRYAGHTSSQNQLTVTVMSFGFKHGVPVETDLMFDVRFLPNPYFEPELRPQRGTDSAVSEYVLRRPEATEFLMHLERMLAFLLPLYEAEGKRYLTVAIGCTGGHHRSVALAEALADILEEFRGERPRVVHRDTLR